MIERGGQEVGHQVEPQKSSRTPVECNVEASIQSPKRPKPVGDCSNPQDDRHGTERPMRDKMRSKITVITISQSLEGPIANYGMLTNLIPEMSFKGVACKTKLQYLSTLSDEIVQHRHMDIRRGKPGAFFATNSPTRKMPKVRSGQESLSGVHIHQS